MLTTLLGVVRKSWRLYVLYDFQVRCRYVGITARGTVGKRFAEHARTKKWWPEIDQSRTVIKEIEGGRRVTRRHAELVESGVITRMVEAGHPLENKQVLEGGLPGGFTDQAGEVPFPVAVVVGVAWWLFPWVVLVVGVVGFVAMSVALVV